MPKERRGSPKPKRRATRAARAPSGARDERERILARLVAASADAVSIRDASGRFTWVNRAFVRIYGWSAKEVLGRPATILDARRDDPWIREEGGTRYLWHARRDGSDLPVAVTEYRVGDSIAQVARDVTAEMASEEAHRRSEMQFRSVVERANDGVITLSPQGLIESFNPAAERIFGWSAADVRGRPIEMLLPTLLGSLGVLPRVVEMDALRRDARRVPLEVSLSVLPTRSGHAVAAFVRDVSERREIGRLKDEFVAMVSHDLKTPLTSIGLSLAILREEKLGTLTPEARGVLEVATRNVARMVKLADDVLDLKKLEAGRMELARARVALPPLVERCLEMVRPVGAARGIAFEADLAPLEVTGDPERLAQVLTNLLSNAIAFTPDGGRVGVELLALPRWAEVRVVDEGPGVPAEHRESIFERFRQGPGAPVPGVKGSGLGLAICKAIVAQHGGEIGVTARDPHGSCFWFRLPRAGR